MNLPANLKNLRVKKGLSQRKLAEELRLTRNQISFYEQGVSQPSLEICLRIAKYFNTTMEKMIK